MYVKHHEQGKVADLCNHLPFLQVVSHQHDNCFAVEHKVQHGWPVLQMAPHVTAEEVDVDQMLQCWIPFHADAQLLSDPAACTIRRYQVVTFQVVRQALQHYF